MLLLTSFWAPGVLTADNLWDKAVALVEASKAWMPSLSTTSSLDLNDKGAVVETIVTDTRYNLDKQGRMARQNFRVVKNGLDQAPDAVSKATDGQKGPTDPLERDAQSITKIEPFVAGTWKGRPVQIYPFTFRPPGGTGIKGQIWIDKETAAAVHRESTVDPPPPFVKLARIVQDAELDPRGFLATTTLDIEFAGSFLGLTKHMKVTTQMRDWQLKASLGR